MINYFEFVGSLWCDVHNQFLSPWSFTSQKTNRFTCYSDKMDCQKKLTSILIGCNQQRVDLNVFSNGWAELIRSHIISAYIVQNTSDTLSNNRIAWKER